MDSLAHAKEFVNFFAGRKLYKVTGFVPAILYQRHTTLWLGSINERGDVRFYLPKLEKKDE